MPFVLSRINAKSTPNVHGPYYETGIPLFPGAPEVPFTNFEFTQNVYRFSIDPGVILTKIDINNLPLVPNTSLIPSALALSLDGNDWAAAEEYLGEPLTTSTLFVAELLFKFRYRLSSMDDFDYNLSTASDPASTLANLTSFANPGWELHFSETLVEQVEGLFQACSVTYYDGAPGLFPQDTTGTSSADRALVLATPAFIPHDFEITINKADAPNTAAGGVKVRYLSPRPTYPNTPTSSMFNLIASANQASDNTNSLALLGQTDTYQPEGTLLHVAARQTGAGDNQTPLLIINYRATRIVNPLSQLTTIETPTFWSSW